MGSINNRIIDNINMNFERAATLYDKGQINDSLKYFEKV